MPNPKWTRSPAARDGPTYAGAVTREARELEILMDQLREANEHLVLANLRAQNLAERAGHLAAIVASSDDAIYSKTLQGVITSWNKGAVRIYGYAETEAVGASVRMLMPRDRLAEMPSLLARIAEGETIERFDTVRLRKDGSPVDVSLTISPIRTEGRIVAAAVIARDITERKKAEQERADLLRRAQAARTDAETASRQKDEFLATVSHELRTPLTAVMGWARMVTSGRLSASQVKHGIEAIERNAAALAHLIEDLLDLTRIESGKLQLASNPVDLAALTREAVEAAAPLAAEKRIHVVYHPPAAAPAVQGDAGRLQQVIGNLLTNAIKFTPAEGRVYLSIAPIRGNVQLTVRDTGQGIDAAFLPHVFERFQQGDTGTTRQSRGLGLGLAIVQQIVHLHGGSVEAASEGRGRGATFTVRLPIPAVSGRHRPAGASGQGAGDPGRLDGLRVIVVDADRDGCALTALLLEQAGATVRAAGTAAGALRTIAVGPADVLVTGIGLPDGDGFALLRRLRDQEAVHGRFTPVIALTAHGGSETRRRLHEAGFQAHIVKPFEPAELVATIRSFTLSPSASS